MGQDIYTLFHLDRNFKFISKLSNFLIPIIGWSMFITGMGNGPWNPIAYTDQRAVRARSSVSISAPGPIASAS